VLLGRSHPIRKRGAELHRPGKFETKTPPKPGPRTPVTGLGQENRTLSGNGKKKKKGWPSPGWGMSRKPVVTQKKARKYLRLKKVKTVP